jgi:DNA-binding beta-propeller fold protein YncE
VAVSTTGATAGYVYVANGDAATVSVINPDRVVVNTIDLGAFGYGVAVSPTGANAGNVYITNFSNGTVSVISA